MQRSDRRYQETLHYLLDRVNFEKSTDRACTQNNFQLARMAYLLELLENPQLAAPVIHVAGTKGKGSVCWLLAEAFRRNGLRTGLFTSPHLVDLEERFAIDSQAIEPGELVEIVDQIRAADRLCSDSQHGQPTFFELTNAIGWLAFRNHKTQVNVIEVGLGGRLDSTNVCSPALCIITSISYDHQLQLGDTLAEIAGEKAGIIKPNIPVICGARTPEASKVIQARAQRQGSELLQLGRDFDARWTPDPDSLRARLDYAEYPELPDGKQTNFEQPATLRMLGKHQSENAAIAMRAWRKLKQLGWDLQDRAIEESLAQTQVPARLEVLGLDPTWILDSAHNEASIDALVDALESYFPSRPKTILFACAKDKKAPEMLERLVASVDRIVLTQFRSNPRFTPVEKLLEIANSLVSKARRADQRAATILSCEDLPGALRLVGQSAELRGQTNDPSMVYVITGSFFIASEAKAYFASCGQIGPS
ncbi:MAG: bifunctional folylpolyglutamate synthase/dihydrofolate synthase [Pirellula sp.]|jgi:dihydrofolate synthase/folylpolyglutamate synthase|nr:bifunctional folylpolyglutamate synthase/dihydrofolate synthase [Pirellula sp.]